MFWDRGGRAKAPKEMTNCQFLNPFHSTPTNCRNKTSRGRRGRRLQLGDAPVAEAEEAVPPAPPVAKAMVEAVGAMPVALAQALEPAGAAGDAQ